ncbi:helix-turn-helix transcriptional regulator, partial [Anaerococcus hydrogenalis]|uniref:helix-turn-helix domain-containing protein n=1 Tax=Anaerococcus hydrogenalis TaxID=33029 RepID=UPI002903BC9D
MNNTISENLAFYRRKRNLTQKELAEKTGLSISFISHIENKVSEPSDENLKKIADALGVLPSDLKSDGDLKKIKNENIELVKLLIKLTREEKIKWDYDNDSSAWG